MDLNILSSEGLLIQGKVRFKVASKVKINKKFSLFGKRDNVRSVKNALAYCIKRGSKLGRISDSYANR